jgi:hypothetical protein
MLKGVVTLNDVKILMVGLSFQNLDKLRAEPLDGFIKIVGKDIGLPIDIWIFAGETESHLYDFVQGGIDEHTIVHISDKLKSS